jgi:hypothetical protein
VQCRPVTSSVQSYMWIRHADIAFCGISLSPSLLGVKRTWLVAACVSRRIFHVLCACPARGPLFTCGSPYKPTMTRCDCSRAQLPSTLVVVDRLGEPRTPRLFHFPSVIQRGQRKGPGRVTNPALTTAPLWGEKRWVARSSRQRFAELLRSCSRHISPTCCVVAHAAEPGCTGKEIKGRR